MPKGLESTKIVNLNTDVVLEYSFPALANVLDRAFTGYVLPMHFTTQGVATMVRNDGVDLAASRILLRDNQPVGVALIARRGWTSRLAAMGIAPEMRGQRAGQWFMQQLLDESRGRGERTMVLEVIEQNPRAVRLYENVGFTRRRRLVGLVAERLTPTAAPTGDQLEEFDPRSVAELVTRYGLADLPWQLSGETLALAGPPARGYRLGPAFAAISDPAQPRISLRSLVVLPEARRQSHATALLNSLIAQFPDKTWAIPAIMPEELALPVFERLGFMRDTISQFQMETSL